MVTGLFLGAAAPCLGEFEVLSRDVAGLNFLGGARELPDVLLVVGEGQSDTALVSHQPSFTKPGSINTPAVST